MKVNFEAKFDSGESKFNGLDLYYGADSIGAIAEAVSLTTHAIIHNEVIKQTPSVKGFTLKFKNSHTGSFRQKFELEFTDAESVRVIEYLSVEGFTELLAIHLALPLGYKSSLENSRAKSWFRTYMENGEELIERLDRPLQRIHHPVTGQGYQVTLLRARTPIVGFNNRTYDYLTGSEISEARESVEMAVSRFNARTGTGRFIDDEESESISFSPQRGLLRKEEKSLLVDSLKDLTNDRLTKIRAEVTRINSRDGRTKHFILHGVYEI